MTYATVCSGIECMSAACADMPLEPAFFSEIEPFPCAVLKSHFPNVPNLGDMSRIKATNDGKEITNDTTRIVLDERLDIFAGGTPCQDVSIAGKRGGMQEGSGTRSSLAFEFVRLVRELKPRYVLWENVAGVLSDKSFPEFLTALADCGYGVAYRTLDAQWVRAADCYHPDGRVVRMERAIPQRRRRVWVVGCAGGDVAKASQILFEHASIVGNTPPRRRTGQEIARALAERNQVHDRVVEGASGDGEIKLRRTNAKGEDVASTITAQISEQSGQDAVANSVVECFENHATDARVRKIDVAMCIGASRNASVGNNNPLVVSVGLDGYNLPISGDVAQTIMAAGSSLEHIGGIISTNSNGEDVAATLDGRDQSASSPGAQEDKRGGYVIQKKEAISYGFNPVASGVMLDSLPAKETGMTLRKSPGGENGVILVNAIAQMKYIVRRPTPIECERLMGLPDGWTIPSNLKVTDALVEEFRQIHDNFNRIMWEYSNKEDMLGDEDEDGNLPKAPPPKPKTANQVRKWLKKIANPDTCPDAPRLKGDGNGWATNQPRWILSRMLAKEGIDPWGGAK